MNLIDIESLGKNGVIKIEITVSDLVCVVKDVANATATSFLEKMNKERSPELITRKEAKKMLNITTDCTMIKWEDKGFLKPYRIGGRIFYQRDEIIAAFERFSRESQIL